MFKHYVKSGFLSEVQVYIEWGYLLWYHLHFLFWTGCCLYFKDVPRGVFFHISAFLHIWLCFPNLSFAKCVFFCFRNPHREVCIDFVIVFTVELFPLLDFVIACAVLTLGFANLPLLLELHCGQQAVPRPQTAQGPFEAERKFHA